MKHLKDIRDVLDGRIEPKYEIEMFPPIDYGNAYLVESNYFTNNSTNTENILDKKSKNLIKNRLCIET